MFKSTILTLFLYILFCIICFFNFSSEDFNTITSLVAYFLMLFPSLYYVYKNRNLRTSLLLSGIVFYFIFVISLIITPLIINGNLMNYYYSCEILESKNKEELMQTYARFERTLLFISKVNECNLPLAKDFLVENIIHIDNSRQGSSDLNFYAVESAAALHKYVSPELRQQYGINKGDSKDLLYWAKFYQKSTEEKETFKKDVLFEK